MASTVDGASASRPPARVSILDGTSGSRPHALPMASSVAGASTSRSPSKWAVLTRVPEFVDPSDLAATMEYTVSLAAPPGISTLKIFRAVVPIPAFDDLQARVECADAEGNLVLSIRSETAGPGGRALLVCRAGTGRVDLLPSIVPDDVLRFGSDASTGILAAPPGCFMVVHLQRAATASSRSTSMPASASHSHLALCYSSSSRRWTSNNVATKQAQATDGDDGWLMVEEVRGQQEGEAFHPNTVVAHEDGRHLAFVDITSGALLLFDGMSPSSARLVKFPDSGIMMEPDVKGAETSRCVACSQGAICLIDMRQDGSVALWTLGDQDQWHRKFIILSDEIVWSNHSLGNALSLARAGIKIGPLNPAKQNQLIVYAPEAGMGLTVEVDLDPNKMWPQRVKLCEQAATGDCRGSCLDVLVWRFSPANPAAVAQGSESAAQGGWMQDLADRSKHLGVRAVKTYRKHIDKALPVAQVVGSVAGFFSIPNVPVVAATASGLSTFNKATTSVEELHKWWTGGAPLDIKVVGNEHEARQVIKEWKALNRPNNMLAEPYWKLNQQEVTKLRLFFITHDAKALLGPDLSEYEIVSKGLRF